MSKGSKQRRLERRLEREREERERAERRREPRHEIRREPRSEVGRDNDNEAVMAKHPRGCAQCGEVVLAQRDSISLVQDGEHKLFHGGCYREWRRETLKQLRKEAHREMFKSDNRERISTACLTCHLKRTRVFSGSADAPHIRVCANGHFQMVTVNGPVATTERAAEVWKVNSVAWHGQTITARVHCTVCNEEMSRADGMDHVLERHSQPEKVEEPEPPPPKEEPVVVAQRVENLRTQQKGGSVSLDDLRLDDLLMELVSRISTRIAGMEQATQELKMLVEQLLRGGR